MQGSERQQEPSSISSRWSSTESLRTPEQPSSSNSYGYSVGSVSSQDSGYLSQDSPLFLKPASLPPMEEKQQMAQGENKPSSPSQSPPSLLQMPAKSQWAHSPFQPGNFSLEKLQALYKAFPALANMNVQELMQLAMNRREQNAPQEPETTESTPAPAPTQPMSPAQLLHTALQKHKEKMVKQALSQSELNPLAFTNTSDASQVNPLAFTNINDTSALMETDITDLEEACSSSAEPVQTYIPENAGYISPERPSSSSSFALDSKEGIVKSESPSGSSSSDVPMLPPCRVCGEKASGLHYGVNTCEACKGFFRRSLQRKTPLKCDKEKKCQIGIGKRNSCAHCRLVKCQAVGMSKDAIKTGRYTHAKRTKDTQEIKRLQKEKTKFEGEDCRLRVMSGFKEEYPTLEEYTQDMQKFIETVDKRIEGLGENAIISPTNVASTVDKFMEDYMMQVELFGKMQPLSSQEYMAFYKATGIDIDQRRQLVVDWTNMAEIGVRKMIKFAKEMPGFTQLSLADQIGLIKGARFEVGFIGIHKRFNTEKQCFLTPRGIVRTRAEMLKLWDTHDYIDDLFRLAGRLQDLKLSVSEMVCVMAMSLFSADRCTLENRPLVESSQKLYLDIIQYSFKKNHPGQTDLIGKLFSVLVQLREMNQTNIQMIANVKLHWRGDIPIPELIREMTEGDGHT